jgi:acyl dehydratase
MSPKDLPIPVEQRHFEDYAPGSIGVYGPIALTEADIVEFALRYDPQPMHTDPVAAARGPFGGLIASGWHTTGLVMRVLVERYLSHVAALVSPGIDVLSVRITVLEASISRSKPDRGLIRTFIEAVNQKDEVVMSLKAMNFLRRRTAGAPDQVG